MLPLQILIDIVFYKFLEIIVFLRKCACALLARSPNSHTWTVATKLISYTCTCKLNEFWAYKQFQLISSGGHFLTRKSSVIFNLIVSDNDAKCEKIKTMQNAEKNSFFVHKFVLHYRLAPPLAVKDFEYFYLEFDFLY